MSIESASGPVGGTRLGGLDDRQRSRVLAVVLAGLFTVSLTITVLSNSLDRIASDLSSSRSIVLWSITGPMLAFGVVGPALGKAGDLWGHRRVFIAGLLGAALFALLTAVAWDAGSMIAFRTLSATSGAACGPSAMAYVNRMYGPSERVRPLGYWSFVQAGAPVLGVVIGAPIVSLVGWRVIFFAQAPLCALGAFVAFRLLPETNRAQKVRFDVGGAVTLGGGASLGLIAVNRGNDWGWGSGRFLGALFVAALLLGAFVSIERRAAEPLLPLGWLRRRNLMSAMTGQMLSNFAYMGSFMMAPALLQNALGYSETHSGLMLIARPAAFSIAASRAGVVGARIGERGAAIVGTSAVVASMATFALVRVDSGAPIVLLALALAGIGMGVASPAMVASVANSVDEKDLGVAGAMQQLLTQLGAVLGAEVMQSVQLAGGREPEEISGYTAAFLTAVVVSAFGVAVASRLRSAHHRHVTVSDP
jgi:MFS family permease